MYVQSAYCSERKGAKQTRNMIVYNLLFSFGKYTKLISLTSVIGYAALIQPTHTSFTMTKHLQGLMTDIYDWLQATRLTHQSLNKNNRQSLKKTYSPKVPCYLLRHFFHKTYKTLTTSLKKSIYESALSKFQPLANFTTVFFFI